MCTLLFYLAPAQLFPHLHTYTYPSITAECLWEQVGLKCCQTNERGLEIVLSQAARVQEQGNPELLNFQVRTPVLVPLVMASSSITEWVRELGMQVFLSQFWWEHTCEERARSMMLVQLVAWNWVFTLMAEMAPKLAVTWHQQHHQRLSQPENW